MPFNFLKSAIYCPFLPYSCKNFIVSKTFRMFVRLKFRVFISLMSFSLIYIAPGDPAEIMMTSPSGGYDEAAVEVFRIAHGLDQPFYIQYINWLKNAAAGDFGYSYMSEQPVFETVLNAFRNTLTLSVLALAIALIIAIPSGVVSALKHNTVIDDACRFLALFGVSMPNLL